MKQKIRSLLLKFIVAADLVTVFLCFPLPIIAVILAIGSIIVLIHLLMTVLVMRGRVKAPITEAKRVLEEECDPYPLLEYCEKRLSHSTGRRETLRLDRAYAYFTLGQTARAVKEFRYLLEVPGSGPGTCLTASYYLAAISIRSGDLQSVQRYAVLLRRDMARMQPVLRRWDREHGERNLRWVQARLDLAQGSCGAMRALLEERRHSAASRAAKVNMAEDWACVFREEGDTQRLKEALRYVARYGNRLYIALQARAELKRMGEAVPARETPPETALDAAYEETRGKVKREVNSMMYFGIVFVGIICVMVLIFALTLLTG